MLVIKFSKDADTDLEQIAEHTWNTWGQRQLAKYMNELDKCFERIRKNPLLGRKSESTRPEFRRIEVGRHAVFYIIEPDAILIVRVLHQQMLPANYF
ncbi:type II toxin-antitoxin system RelE/ParE family toxin [Terracidiphilus sp.]|jgi:toxin ParE1/3/4|uniref:type II toxin-antitoxin system RelE/ParE family toxin n=1 Tax=Terracidiphilus sp. TaxID=1964191 RepID=UPI003C796778